MNAAGYFPQRANPPLERFIPNPKLKFMEQCREVMRFRRLALRSEQAYLDWIKRYIFFHAKRHPKDMGAAEVEGFLTHLAVKCKVSASTQNQAFNALLFLYRHIIKKDFGDHKDIPRAKQSRYVPVVLTRREIDSVLGHLEYPYSLVVKLLYGCGLRLF